MGKWRIIEKRRDGLTDAVMTLASLGAYALSGEKTYAYVVEHVDTGEIKKIHAPDEYELGETISSGDFDDD